MQEVVHGLKAVSSSIVSLEVVSERLFRSCWGMVTIAKGMSGESFSCHSCLLFVMWRVAFTFWEYLRK